MVSLGSLIIAVAAIGLGLSGVDPLFYVGIAIAAAIYLVLAFVVYACAMKMDQRRKMAHAWIRAIEDELGAQGKSAITRSKISSGIRSGGILPLLCTALRR